MRALDAPTRSSLSQRARTAISRRPALRSAWQFASGNLILNICSVVWTLTLPKQLGLDEFAEWRLFLLYSGLVGVLHFGLLDALLYRWARRKSLAVAPSFWSVTGLIACEGLLLCAAFAVLARLSPPGTFDLRVALPLAAYAATWNVITVAQYALQANRSFGALSAFTACQAVLFLTLTLTGVMRAGSWASPAWLFTMSNVAAAALCIVPAIRNKGARPANVRRIGALTSAAVRRGFSILFVNLLLLLLVNADRFTVSIRFSKSEFALYAFGASLVGLGSSAAVVASRFLVPFISRWHQQDALLNKLPSLNAVLFSGWIALLGCGFCAQLLIQHQYPRYSASLLFAAILGVGLAFSSPVQIIHLNYARVARRLRQSTMGSVVAVALGIVFMASAALRGSMIGIAAAGTATFAIWWLLGVLFVLPRDRRLLAAQGIYVGAVVITVACAALSISSGLPSAIFGLGCIGVAIMTLVWTSRRFL